MPTNEHEQQVPTNVPRDPAHHTRRIDRLLDDAIEDTFPASDPVALAMPHDFEAPARPARRYDFSHRLPLVLIGGVIAALLFARRG